MAAFPSRVSNSAVNSGAATMLTVKRPDEPAKNGRQRPAPTRSRQVQQRHWRLPPSGPSVRVARALTQWGGIPSPHVSVVRVVLSARVRGNALVVRETVFVESH